MAKKTLEDWEIKLYQEDEEGRKYLEYNEKVGGEPLGMIVPFGYPENIDQYNGSVIAVYDECIKRGITWEELLEHETPDDVII